MNTIPELPLEPRDPKTIGHCAWCGDDIQEGELFFAGDAGDFHSECVLEYARGLIQEMGVNTLAWLIGLEGVVQ